MLEREVNTKKVYSVLSLNFYIKNIFDEDPFLSSVKVKGELSNVKKYPSGHIYFTLKEKESKINCVMFKYDALSLTTFPKEGEQVVIDGSVKVYLKNGAYQLYVKNIEKEGIGKLYLQFEKRKARLKEEGLFDENNKKPLLKYPFNIGLICGNDSAAKRDVYSTINRRWPLAKIHFFPSKVQGEKASEEIIKKLRETQNYSLDVIILTRGGGSFEDLFEFNNEKLAREIFALKTPIVSAIGHESDFTIAEFVSDKRGATPTAAAEITTPNIADVLDGVKQKKEKINDYLDNILEDLKVEILMLRKEVEFSKYFDYLDKKREFYNFLNERLEMFKEEFYKDKRSKLRDNKEKLLYLFDEYFKKKKETFLSINQNLIILSPQNIFKRGYASLKFENKIVKSIKQVKKNDIVTTRVYDGQIKSKILEKRSE